LIVVIILEMDSPVSSATPNSDALSYFPVEIDDQCMFDDESSSRAKTTVVQYHDDSANASACASSASDANIGRIDDGHVNDRLSANSDANRVMISAVKDSVNSASDASQNIGKHSAVDNDLMGDQNKNASGKNLDDTIGSAAQNLLLSDLLHAPGQWHRALGEVRSVLTRSLDITELPDPKKQKVFEPETEQMEQLLATLQRME